jgi:hypothetical protein
MALPSRCSLALLGLLALSTPSHAAGPLIFRVEGGTTDHSSRTISSSMSGHTELSLDGGNGFGVAGEYRLGPRTGIELSWSSIDLDAEWRAVMIRLVSTNPNVFREEIVGSDSGTLTVRPLAATFLFHPFHHDRMDFYLGPQAAWVQYQQDFTGPPDRNEEIGFGGKLGLDLALGRSPWSAGVSYRFLSILHDGIEHDLYKDIDLNLVSAVLSYRVGGGAR